ncbi:MAG: pilus assembly protein PilM [Candidatus Brocadiales bacterium]
MARSEPVIGMEAARGQMKLVEMVSSAARLEVTNFAIVELPPGGTRLIGPRLHNTLKELGFRAKTINAIIPYPSIEYRQVSLPPMSKADMKTAAGREAKKNLKFPAEELVTDYEVVGESEEKGLRRIELLLARAQSRDMEELSSMAKEFGLKFNSLTVVPAALLNLLRMRSGVRDEALAMVHIGEDNGTIIILHQGNLRFPREFPLRLGAESVELAERLVGEIKRSLLSVKQRARGLTVNKILLLGEIIQPDVLADTITSETGVHTEVYAPMGLDLSPLGERVHEFRESLSKLSIPLGLAWNGPEHSSLNLMSQQLAILRKLALAKVTVTSIGVLLAVLLAAYYILLQQKVGPYKEDHERLKRELATLRPQTRDMKEIQKERDLQGARIAFTNKMSGPTIPWSEILRTLSLSVPDEMLLHSIEVKEAEVGWTLKVSGEVKGRDAHLVKKSFNEFFSLLLTCPSLSEGKVESLTIGPVTGARRMEASRLEFTVNARVQYKESLGGITKG